MTNAEQFDVSAVLNALAQAELDHTHALQRSDEDAVNEALERADEIKALLAANGFDDEGNQLVEGAVAPASDADRLS